jgi:hypothetical protein
MQTPVAERREFQRLRLELPIPGTLDDNPVFIAEIGVLGARIRHSGLFNFETAELLFPSDYGPIHLRCERIRTTTVKSQSFSSISQESGVRFIAALGESGDRLRLLLTELVTGELSRRKSAPPPMSTDAIDADRILRARDAGYLCYTLESGGWQKRRVLLPEQPENGFTVVRDEDGDEMQRLCAVFEAADEEGRRLIHMLAELSVSQARNVPPRRES